jgi:hypothetical protein
MSTIAMAEGAAPSAGTPAWIPLVVLAVVAVAALAVVLALRARRPRRRRSGGPQVACPQCGASFPAASASCPMCGWLKPPPPARLEFIFGPLEGQTVPLAAEVTTLGSAAGNTVVLPDPGVSRKHVGIRRDRAGYEMADLGSTNGVYVNGQRLAKRLLVGGDIIRIGSSEMVFHLEKVG